jgi:hypothetical protein
VAKSGPVSNPGVYARNAAGQPTSARSSTHGNSGRCGGRVGNCMESARTADCENMQKMGTRKVDLAVGRA